LHSLCDYRNSSRIFANVRRMASQRGAGNFLDSIRDKENGRRNQSYCERIICVNTQ
jgi:hypothetical protein